MPVGIDVGNAGVVALEKQPVGRDDAELILQRRHAPIGPALSVDQHVAAPPLDVRLELRRQSVSFGLDDAAHFLARSRNLQALRAGRGNACRGGDRGAGQRCAVAHEAASFLELIRIARRQSARNFRLRHDRALPGQQVRLLLEQRDRLVVGRLRQRLADRRGCRPDPRSKARPPGRAASCGWWCARRR